MEIEELKLKFDELIASLDNPKTQNILKEAEYDIEKLQDSENYTFDVNRMKIEYKNEPPIIGLDDIYNKDGFLIKMFGTKSKSWEYENEIRLIYSTSKRKGYNPFALKSIYFGLNMDEMHQIQIIEGLTNRDIRFYKM